MPQPNAESRTSPVFRDSRGRQGREEPIVSSCPTDRIDRNRRPATRVQGDAIRRRGHLDRCRGGQANPKALAHSSRPAGHADDSWVRRTPLSRPAEYFDTGRPRVDRSVAGNEVARAQRARATGSQSLRDLPVYGRQLLGRYLPGTSLASAPAVFTLTETVSARPPHDHTTSKLGVPAGRSESLLVPAFLIALFASLP